MVQIHIKINTDVFDIKYFIAVLEKKKDKIVKIYNLYVIFFRQICLLQNIKPSCSLCYIKLSYAKEHNNFKAFFVVFFP